MQRTHEISQRVNKTGGRIYIKNDIATGASRRSSQKPVQEIHGNIQGPLHWGHEWMCKENAHAIVLPTTNTGGRTTTSTMTVASEPRHVGICTCVPRSPQLHQTSIHTNRNGIPGARQNSQTANVCTMLEEVPTLSNVSTLVSAVGRCLKPGRQV